MDNIQVAKVSTLPVGERGGGLLTLDQHTLWHSLIDAAHHIVITCHRGPDGDAIGSTTALASWLRRRMPEADIHIIAPNIFPDFLKWIPGAEDILIYEGHEDEVRPIIEAADLIIMCDHGELKRMWTLGDVVRDHPTPRIMIDHHLDPEPGIADLVISHPALSSTCEILLRIILELEPASPFTSEATMSEGSPSGLPLLTTDEAASLYTGMMTDTGAFTYASSRPEIFELISILLSYGIDKDKIYRNIFFTYSPNRMKLMGYMLYVKLDVWKKAHTSVMTLRRARKHTPTDSWHETLHIPPRGHRAPLHPHFPTLCRRLPLQRDGCRVFRWRRPQERIRRRGLGHHGRCPRPRQKSRTKIHAPPERSK